MFRFRILLIQLLIFSSSLLAEIEYSVSFKGVHDKSLIESLNSHSQSFILKNRPPTSELALKRRAEEDIPIINEILNHNGYYEPTVSLELQPEKDKIRVIFFINKGPLFTLSSFQIEGLPDGFEITESELDTAGIQPGSALKTNNFITIKNILTKKLRNNGYPFSKTSSPQIEINLKNTSGRVTLIVSSGPHLRFGEYSIHGNNKVKNIFIREKISWNRGEWFSLQKVSDTQKALEKSGLFTHVKITYPKKAHTVDGNELPISIDLEEGKYRTIGAGLSYSTHKGPGVTAEWQHRNIGSVGNLLTASGFIAEKERHLKVGYKHFNFFKKNQTFNTYIEDGKEKVKAYTNTYQIIKLGMDTPLPENIIRLQYGLEFTNEQASRSNNDNRFLLVSLPISIYWKKTNEKFYPSKGERILYSVKPSFDLKDDRIQFMLQQMKLSYYFPIWEKNKISGSFSLQLASLIGQDTEKLPPPNRIYAGSEENLRGYSYMTVSPLSSSGNPVGGRSMLLYSFGSHIPIVDGVSGGLFFEMGNVFNSSWPKLDRKLLKSTGFSLNYHTPAGPLSATLAFPLDKRSNLDKTLQAYLSFAKTF